tara:strand:+ start:4951 stop:5397 length:447 start_codon:yes stop_codon:yes gene_type:complete
MHDKEVKYFVDGLSHAKDEFYLDAIKVFKNLIDLYPDSELVDDSLYNIGLCYFQMLQFENAIKTFSEVINHYPDSTISVLDGGNEFGKTAAKCHYANVNCYLAIGDTVKANDEVLLMKKFKNTYKLINEVKVTFYEIALNAINKYENI